MTALNTADKLMLGPFVDRAYLGGSLVWDMLDRLETQLRAQLSASGDAIYDISVTSSLFQDAAGTTPVTAIGQTVKRVNDVSGNGHHWNVSSGTTNVTYQVDANGRPYLAAPSGSFLASAATKTLGRRCYIGAAIAPTREGGSTVMFCVGKDNANLLGISELATASRLDVALKKTGLTNVSLNTPAGSASLNIPVVVDALSDDTVSSWINGGGTPFSDPLGSNGGARSKATTWAESDSIATCRYGLNNSGGFSQTTAACNFYAGYILHANPGTARSALNNWLKWKAGLLPLEKRSYDVFLVAGQSNAQGVGNRALSTAVPFGAGIEYQGSGYIKPLADPTQHKLPTAVGNQADYSLTGSAWPAFSAKYYELKGRPVCIVGHGASGRGILLPVAENWGGGAGGTLPAAAVAKLNSAVAKITSLGVGATVRGVLYLGGEQDATANFTVTSYKAELVALRDRFRTKTGIAGLPLFILSIDDNAGSAAAYALLRQAMAEAAAENEGIELVLSYQDYRGQGLLNGDGVHWSQPALNDAGTKAAVNVAALIP